MNLKKAFLTLLAAGSMLAGGFGGATAQNYSASTSTSVNVNTNTTFNPYFCSASTNFGTVNLQSNTLDNEAARTKTGTATICYQDTTAWRGTFAATIQASSFTRSGGGGSISNSQLFVDTVQNPQQGQWSTPICGAYSEGGERPCVGDIGGRIDGNAGIPGSAGTNSVPWNSANPETGSLNGQHRIAFGQPGAGTGGDLYKQSPWSGANDYRLNQGSYQNIGLKLIVPQNTPSGEYSGNLNLYVYNNAAP